MQAARLTLPAFLVLASCIPEGTQTPNPPPPLVSIQLTPMQKTAIGQKIWQNECGGSIDGLTTWNDGEDFPSLGIGHFIWYPKGKEGRFRESWPQFVAYAKAKGAQIPAVGLEADCPWPDKASFISDFRGERLSDLRRWLLTHIQLQTDFIIDRSLAALPTLLEAAPASERDRILKNYEKVASTPHGTYALIDYVNFKGDGTLASERYHGQGWGLLQVLSQMRDVPAGQPAANEFASAAIQMLERRVSNSPPERREQQWLKGWRNRCLTYAQALR